MIATHPAFDPSRFEWQRLTDESETGYTVDDSVALLGYDLKVIAEIDLETLVQMWG